MPGKPFIAAAALIFTAPAVAHAGPASAGTAMSTIQASTPVDPMTLAKARQVATRLLPPGIYKKILGSVMGPMFDNMGDMVKSMPLKQLAEIGGLDGQQAAALDKVDVAEVMAIYDPHWQEREKLSVQAMMDAMAEFFTTVEPDLREAMAQAYAHHFTAAELDDLNRFFATASGAKFANRYMTIMTDPAMIDATKSMMPKMMQQMPQFIRAAQRAAAALPPPRKIEDLSPAEKAKLAKALGVDESKLQDPKKSL